MEGTVGLFLKTLQLIRERKFGGGVARWCSKNGVHFVRQKRFPNCRDKYTLPFDFYLPHYKTCIEYDGIHHRKGFWKFGGKDLPDIKRKDAIKTRFCEENEIKLVRIPDTDINRIEQLLLKKLTMD
jgi:very-short-patch-repair endonuclease